MGFLKLVLGEKVSKIDLDHIRHKTKKIIIKSLLKKNYVFSKRI